MRGVGLVVIACLGFSTAAVAKDPPEDKIVCKRQQEADTGSHFASAKKVCMKKSEWKEMEDQAERMMNKVRNGGAAGPLSASSGGPG